MKSIGMKPRMLKNANFRIIYVHFPKFWNIFTYLRSTQRDYISAVLFQLALVNLFKKLSSKSHLSKLFQRHFFKKDKN